MLMTCWTWCNSGSTGSICSGRMESFSSARPNYFSQPLFYLPLLDPWHFSHWVTAYILHRPMFNLATFYTRTAWNTLLRALGVFCLKCQNDYKNYPVLIPWEFSVMLEVSNLNHKMYVYEWKILCHFTQDITAMFKKLQVYYLNA